MVRWVLCAFLAWLFLAVPAVASDRPPPRDRQEAESILNRQELTLADLLGVAELRNPALAAARSAVRANAARARQAGLYPNPIFEFEVEEVSTNDPDIRKDKVSVVQPLIISGRRGAAVAAARANENAAVHLLEQTRRDLYRGVHSLWAEQLYFRETHGALAGLLGVARRTLEIAQARFDARATPESQVTRALLEVYELEIAERLLARERDRASAELEALLGGTRVPLDRLVGTLDPDSLTRQIIEEDITLHPAVRAAASRVEAAEAIARESRSERIPDLDLFMSYGRVRPDDDGFLEAGVSVPIPLFNRNQGRVAESQALVAEAQDRMRIIESDFQVALAAASGSYQAIRDELRASDDQMRPAAERALAQAQEGYRVGRLPFLELIDAQRTFSTIRLRNLELRRDLVIAEAELLSLAGIGLYGDTGERE
jgi:cobalt-zinc-cadmium efflux system outer membrane protein